jgi:hypothetical protein
VTYFGASDLRALAISAGARRRIAPKRARAQLRGRLISEKALVILECEEAFENTALLPLNDTAQRLAHAESDVMARTSVNRVAGPLQQLTCYDEAVVRVPTGGRAERRVRRQRAQHLGNRSRAGPRVTPCQPRRTLSGGSGRPPVTPQINSSPDPSYLSTILTGTTEAKCDCPFDSRPF